MGLSLKSSNVDPTGLKVEMLLGLFAAQSIFNDNGEDCIITSICDSRHAPKSKHWVGYAVDLRSKHLSSSSKNQIFSDLRNALPGYDVLLEQLATPNEHFHIEYDPSR